MCQYILIYHLHAPINLFQRWVGKIETDIGVAPMLFGIKNIARNKRHTALFHGVEKLFHVHILRHFAPDIYPAIRFSIGDVPAFHPVQPNAHPLLFLSIFFLENLQLIIIQVCLDRKSVV